MKVLVVRLLGLLVTVCACGSVHAWSHANAYGGSTYHAEGSGSTTRSGAYGNSETHTYGQGTTASGRYGGSASHQEGSGQTTATGAYGANATHTYGQGTSATNAYGGSAYHATGSSYTSYTNTSGASGYHSAYYRAPVPAYHPPTVVNNYGSGCYNCGGWNTAGAAAAGAVVGVAAGVAVASANNSVATANAYNAGVAAGTSYAMGNVYPTLPAGCFRPSNVNGTYYVCGNSWLAPAYGANGVYYRVVPAP
ncbi:hypothetical protein [Caballeronia insecticola]|uniref:RNA-binding protein n=1 Tax=Caballeronia insecticola TaxID=758793 RepID=R4X3M8_9BURK|nr:hypothetical protein [Caballeronia insecticola]BAN27546.1 putative uncharacterized protein [Caballeronia insecticola]